MPLWNGSLVIDTSLYVQGNASWAAAHVAAVGRYVGWPLVSGVEIGNEVGAAGESGARVMRCCCARVGGPCGSAGTTRPAPRLSARVQMDLFTEKGYRPPSWTYDDYVTEFKAHVSAMGASGMPASRVQGAVYCCKKSSFDGALDAYTAEFAGEGVLASVSYHHYPLDVCNGKTVALWELMEEAAATSTAFMAPFVAAARAAGVPFVIGARPPPHRF